MFGLLFFDAVDKIRGVLKEREFCWFFFADVGEGVGVNKCAVLLYFSSSCFWWADVGKVGNIVVVVVVVVVVGVVVGKRY